MKKYCRKIALMCAASLLLVSGCSKNTETPVTEAESNVSTIKANAADEGVTIDMTGKIIEDTLELSADYLSLKTGETSQLTVSDAEDVTFMSSNPEVATVDENGLVTAIQSGNALIVAEADGKRGTCGVMIDLIDENINIAGKKMTPYLYNLKIAKENTVMQSFTVAPDGTVYTIQQFNSTPSDCVMTKVLTDGTQEYMRLVEFGHGNAIAVDFDEEGNEYLWVPSVGNVEGTSNGMSRIKWESGAYYQEQAGTTWVGDNFDANPNAAVDIESRRLLIFVDPVCYIYDLDAFLSGEVAEPLFITTLYKSAATGEPGSSYYQGIALYGEFIYRYEGDPGEDIYLYTYDLDGNLLYSNLIDGYSELAETYREAEGMAICNGKIYVGIASGLEGFRRANIFTFE